MTTSITETGENPRKSDVKASDGSPSLDLNNLETLFSLMKIYECSAMPDEEENEVERMIQLSGMVPGDTRIPE